MDTWNVQRVECNDLQKVRWYLTFKWSRQTSDGLWQHYPLFHVNQPNVGLQVTMPCWNELRILTEPVQSCCICDKRVSNFAVHLRNEHGPPGRGKACFCFSLTALHFRRPRGDGGREQKTDSAILLRACRVSGVVTVCQPSSLYDYFLFSVSASRRTFPPSARVLQSGQHDSPSDPSRLLRGSGCREEP